MEQINKIAIKIDKRLVYAFEYLNVWIMKNV